MKIWLSREVAASIMKQGQDFSPLETGGLLLGWSDDGNRVVAGLIGPGPNARHHAHKFIPDHPWQMRELEKAFASSGGDLTYLGDWHTHPMGPAQMSRLDERTLSRIARKVDQPVMLIGDPTSGEAPFGAWAAQSLGWRRTEFTNVPIKLFEHPSGWPSILAS